MRILVTGCAGLIGSRVSELLLREGHSVIGVDNLNHAYDVRLKEWRLSRLQGEPRYTFHRLDITVREALSRLFREHSLAGVVNLAARAGVRQSLEDPWGYYETNVRGTLNLLELCRERGVKKLVLASTSSVYGAQTPRPFREEAKTDSSLSPYAASKKAAEDLAHTYHHLYDLDVTVLRYFTVYGPAGRPDMSIFRFIQRIAEDRQITVFGDGTQERDFTYIDDIARGTLAALKPSGYEVINLGSDRPVRLQEVIKLIEGLLGRKAVIEPRPVHPADVPATWADITKARELLKWQPQVPLEDGLKRTVAWYSANRAWAKEIEVGTA